MTRQFDHYEVYFGAYNVATMLIFSIV